MASRRYEPDAWEDDRGGAGGYGAYGADEDAYGDYEEAPYGDDAYDYADGEEQGLILQTDQSLVGRSSTVTYHGAPLLSYTRTMNRFYANRRQRLSLGRYACEVCGERIRLWAWETPNGNRTHDGCYERLAWTWTNLYAQQQRLATDGKLE
jgi:hypothetical protein